MSTSQLFLNSRYKLDLIAAEMRMSHWINAPVLSDTQTGQCLLDLSEDIWDLRSAWETQETICLQLARYPDGNKEFLVEIQPLTGKVFLAGQSYQLAELQEALHALP